MAENSAIEWTDHTFNPWVGCTKVSPACDHCYAETWAKRTGNATLWQGERRRTSGSNWQLPIKWNRRAQIMHHAWAEGIHLHGGDEALCIANGFIKPRRPKVFCASLADVFDNQVPERWRWDLWHRINQTPYLDWLLLTKRPQNIAKMLPTEEIGAPAWGEGWPNVWLGTTAENQTEADRRIPHLLAVPAAVHFLSAEPLLGPLELRSWLPGDDGCEGCDDGGEGGTPACQRPTQPRADQCPRLREVIHSTEGPPDANGTPTWMNCDRVTLDWVIAGGESGPGARPMHPEWARSLRDQCAAAGVAFLFKQWGEWLPLFHDGDYLFPDDGSEGDQAGRLEGRRLPWIAFNADGSRGDHAQPSETKMSRVGKKAAGRLLDGVEHNGMPGHG